MDAQEQEHAELVQDDRQRHQWTRAIQSGIRIRPEMVQTSPAWATSRDEELHGMSAHQDTPETGDELLAVIQRLEQRAQDTFDPPEPSELLAWAAMLRRAQ